MIEMIYGIHAVKAALKCQPALVEQLIMQSKNRCDDIMMLAQAANIPVIEKSRAEIDQLFPHRVVHQGVVASCSQLETYCDADIDALLDKKTKPLRLLVLDGVQDPHNLGACLRTADAFGIDLVIAPKDRSSPVTAVVAKVSCGALFSVPFVRVTNLARTMQHLQDKGIWFVGLSAESEVPLRDIDFSSNMAIVMGAEGSGVRRLTEKHCDYMAHIPMTGQVESLNVSVATGIALYELIR